MKNRADLVWATLGVGGLVLALATIGWATNQPLIFASLGPPAYELVEQPQMPSARPYNVIVGHLLGVGAGFLALYLSNAWAEPNVLATGVVSPHRLWATAISAALTTLACLTLKAGQPAALATTLLISLGAMQTRRDAIAIIVGILLVTAMGEPVRRLRFKRAAATIADQSEDDALETGCSKRRQTNLTGGHVFRSGVEFLRQTIAEEAEGATLGKTAFMACITKSSGA